MRVVFLDIDGVLVNRASIRRQSGRHACADPSCVAQLNLITDATGAVIVLSSTWRFDDAIKETIYGWGVTGTIRSMTPRLRGFDRGIEIDYWLTTGSNSPESFVILDDDSDMAHLKYALVQTNMETGLTKEHADRAIVMLNVNSSALQDESKARTGV